MRTKAPRKFVLPFAAAVALMASGLALAATLGQSAEQPILTASGHFAVATDGTAAPDRAARPERP